MAIPHPDRNWALVDLALAMEFNLSGSLAKKCDISVIKLTFSAM